MTFWSVAQNEKISLKNLFRFLALVFCLSVMWFREAETATNTEHMDNVTRTLDQLLDGYDIRLRPNFGGEPCYIGMDITIASFDSLSEIDMDFTITMYLNQYWKDERLAFSTGDEVLTLPGSFAQKIWVPDTFFANDKESYLHDVTENNTMVRLYGDGAITYGMRFTTTLFCMMDLHYYPLDTQMCTVEIESYGYTVNDLVMYWREIPVMGAEFARLPRFSINGFEVNERTELLATGSYKRLSIMFKLSRNIAYFIFQSYLPSCLIVMLSWVTFWINHEASPARVGLGITTVLTMTTISTGLRSSLPRISYVKAIDIYLVMSHVFVFAALLEYAAVNFIHSGKKPNWELWKKKPLLATPPPIPKSPPPDMENGGSGQKEDTTNLRQRNVRKIFSKESLKKLKLPESLRLQSGGTNEGRDSEEPGINWKFRSSLKRKIHAIDEKIPPLKNVNVIDKYSRIIFPITFFVFNVIYWSVYTL